MISTDSEFYKCLKKIIDQKCIQAHISWGSVVLLGFGRKAKYPKEQQEKSERWKEVFFGEFDFTLFCTWFMKYKDKTLVHNNSYDFEVYEQYQWALKGLGFLVDRVVTGIEIKNNCDLDIFFEGEIVFSIVCDPDYIQEDGSHYFYSADNSFYSVDYDQEVEVEDRGEYIFEKE